MSSDIFLERIRHAAFLTPMQQQTLQEVYGNADAAERDAVEQAFDRAELIASGAEVELTPRERQHAAQLYTDIQHREAHALSVLRAAKDVGAHDADTAAADALMQEIALIENT